MGTEEYLKTSEKSMSCKDCPHKITQLVRGSSCWLE